jgi:membrane protein required for colicin V production
VDNLPINVTDLAIVVILGLSAAFAFFRGFAHELLAIGSWIGAGGATLYGFPYAQPEARKYIASPLIADLAAGIVLFLLVLVVLSIATRLLSRQVRNSSLGPLDRSLGLVFGALRGAVLVSIAWLMLLWVVPRDDLPVWVAEARALPLVEKSSELLTRLVPDALGGDTIRAAQALKPDPLGAGSYEDLLNPGAKDVLNKVKPGYKGAERDAIQQLIEATTQNNPPAEDLAQ